MKTLFRILLALVVLVAALIVSAPGLIYLAGISNVKGRPQPGSAPPLSADQRQWLRCEFRADGRDDAPSINPWTRVLNSLKTHGRESYDDNLAWFVARDYNATHLEQRRALYWHISGAALTIWVARHWTQDQMEAQAHALLQGATHFRCPPSPTEWPPP